MPRFEKLLKCDSFKAKAALLTMIGSVVGIGGASNQLVVRNLVPCLVQFVNSEDWAARKASVEALLRLAVREKEMLSEFKPACLKTIEAKRFDKVSTDEIKFRPFSGNTDRILLYLIQIVFLIEDLLCRDLIELITFLIADGR